MRSPVIAFSIFAAAVSPSLVGAAPASPNLAGASAITGSGLADHLPAGLPGNIPGAPGLPTRRAYSDPSDAPVPPSAADIEGFQDRSQRKHGHDKRALDTQTAGGNSYSGGTSQTSGGSIGNSADADNTLINDTGSSEFSFALSPAKY